MSSTDPVSTPASTPPGTIAGSSAPGGAGAGGGSAPSGSSIDMFDLVKWLAAVAIAGVAGFYASNLQFEGRIKKLETLDETAKDYRDRAIKASNSAETAQIAADAAQKAAESAAKDAKERLTATDEIVKVIRDLPDDRKNSS